MSSEEMRRREWYDHVGDVTTVVAHLVFAEANGDPMWGAVRASEALEAFCRLANIPVDELRRRLLNPGDEDDGRD